MLYYQDLYAFSKGIVLCQRDALKPGGAILFGTFLRNVNNGYLLYEMQQTICFPGSRYTTSLFFFLPCPF
jgi:hypothetical protein